MSSIMRFYYDPFAEVDRLFDDAFAARFTPSSAVTQKSNNNRQTAFRPRVDLHENQETNTVTATVELPGLKSDDVSIEVHQNRLTVSGEFKTESREESGYVVRERRQGKFARTLQLPSGVKHEDVKARMEDGLLTVTFPKLTPEQQSHRISISS
ncbi:small heat shock protein [Pisolithus orientalis]|uniref:small heat shock protein n=1 Tax=Pisolithus orientalis TaxID=936130 RepID=UPI002224F76F|nr:small heat shock protein [Pisolithus orientalis]KAI6010888.1 small heat shock protein [Pisolithus orientalis]